MILTLAWRTLTLHPIRSVVLACGFGLGVAVMAMLLGVGAVVLEQAKAPSLVGGGHLVVSGATGAITSTRFVQSILMTAASFRTRVKAASPTTRSVLYLRRGDRVVPVFARGGVPSLERALDDPETAAVAAWTDEPSDRVWTRPTPDDVFRAMDRFHAEPDVPARADSWAEWLYFNGRAGDTRFYLTFLVGSSRSPGRREASVRLQLERAGRQTSYSEGAEVDSAALLSSAPDLTIGRNRVRLHAGRYEIAIDLAGDSDPRARATGALSIEPMPGRAIPPVSIRGAGGWISGYTVPAMAAALNGTLRVDGSGVSLDGGSAYHDHNWGFWRGVSWRWGQVQHENLSFIYGRLFPPADAVDATRVPGLLAALGPDGPIAYTTRVTFDETQPTATGAPGRIVVRGRSSTLDLTLDLAIENAIVTPMGDRLFGGGMDFLQLRAQYHVTGRVGERVIDFTAPGSAETFRGR